MDTVGGLNIHCFEHNLGQVFRGVNVGHDIPMTDIGIECSMYPSLLRTPFFGCLKLLRPGRSNKSLSHQVKIKK